MPMPRSLLNSRILTTAKMSRPLSLTSHLARTFSTSSPALAGATKGTLPVQSTSPYAPIGVSAALAYVSEPSNAAFAPRSKLSDEFSLADRVALVSGANRGLGLEMAMTLSEAGARAVYCLDLPEKPGQEWEAVRRYVEEMSKKEGREGRVEYISTDVTDQKKMWEVGEMIGSREGRLDIGIAAAGILRENTDCLEYPAQEFKRVSSKVSPSSKRRLTILALLTLRCTT